MNPYTQFALLTASSLRMLPHIALYLCHRKEIDRDLCKYGEGDGGVVTFIKVCTRQRVFRNLFYYRMGEYKSVFIKWLLPPERTLNIWCPAIGEGCHFEHNYATYLNAERIGTGFYCLQLVTLGNDKDGKRPTICDDFHWGNGLWRSDDRQQRDHRGGSCGQQRCARRVHRCRQSCKDS